jgi:hypothetical protein
MDVSCQLYVFGVGSPEKVGYFAEYLSVGAMGIVEARRIDELDGGPITILRGMYPDLDSAWWRSV